MTEIVKRILYLMEQRGKSSYIVQRNAKLPMSSFSSWKQDKFKPSTDSIIKLARYFNVSTDYLLCLTDEPTPLKRNDISEANLAMLSELTHDQQFMDSAKLYKALPDEKRENICAYILSIVAGLGLNIQQILGR